MYSFHRRDAPSKKSVSFYFPSLSSLAPAGRDAAHVGGGGVSGPSSQIRVLVEEEARREQEIRENQHQALDVARTS